jgi:hypothetical protein
MELFVSPAVKTSQLATIKHPIFFVVAFCLFTIYLPRQSVSQMLRLYAMEEVVAYFEVLFPFVEIKGLPLPPPPPLPWGNEI